MKLFYLISALALCFAGVSLEAKIITLGMNQSLHAEIQKYDLVIVKYSATWCGPCRTLASAIHSIEKEFPGVTIIDVDVDKHPSVSKHVRGLPTMEFYVKGKKVNSVTGGQDANGVRALIKKNLQASPACAVAPKK